MVSNLTKLTILILTFLIASLFTPPFVQATDTSSTVTPCNCDGVTYASVKFNVVGTIPPGVTAQVSPVTDSTIWNTSAQCCGYKDKGCTLDTTSGCTADTVNCLTSTSTAGCSGGAKAFNVSVTSPSSSYNCTTTPSSVCLANSSDMEQVDVKCSYTELPPDSSSSPSPSIGTCSVDVPSTSITQTGASATVTNPANCSATSATTWGISPSGSISSSGAITGLTAGTPYTVSASRCERACSPASFTSSPTPPGCNNDSVTMSISPNSIIRGNNVTLSVSSSATTNTSDDFGGGLSSCSGSWPNKTCTAANNGDFTWTHSWQVCSGSNCSPTCSKSINYSVGSGGTWGGSCVNGTTYRVSGPASIPTHARRCDNYNSLFWQGQYAGDITVTADTCFNWYSEDCGAGCETQRGSATCKSGSAGNPYSGNIAGAELWLQYPDGTYYDGFGLPSGGIPVYGKRMGDDCGGTWGAQSEREIWDGDNIVGIAPAQNFGFYPVGNLDGTNYTSNWGRWGFWYDSQSYAKESFSHIWNGWRSGCTEDCSPVQTGISMLWPQFPNTFSVNAYVLPADGQYHTVNNTRWYGDPGIRSYPQTKCGGRCVDTDPTYGNIYRWEWWGMATIGNVASLSAPHYSTNMCTTNFDGAIIMTVRPPVTLTVSKIGTGTVTSSNNETSGSNINCGSTCSAIYHKNSPSSDTANTMVTLTAVPAAGYVFSGWTNCNGGASGNTCIVYMNNNITVTATFNKLFTLTVYKTGTNYATAIITDNANKISCFSACSSSYPASALYISGTSVVLTATYDQLATRIINWTGCVPNGNTCTATMDSDKTVTANFGPTLCSYIQTNSGDVYSGTGINTTCAQ